MKEGRAKEESVEAGSAREREGEDGDEPSRAGFLQTREEEVSPSFLWNLSRRRKDSPPEIDEDDVVG